MAISEGDIIEISLRCLMQGQWSFNVWQYQCTSPFASGTPADVGNAWWQNVKALYRAIATEEYAGLFRSVFVRNLSVDPQEYGEYTIPSGEQAGTRVAASGFELLPPFVSAGVRLAVGTSATRPGQKRFFGFVEGDNISGYISNQLQTAITNLMNVMVADFTLPAPALLLTLDPVVVRKDAAGLVAAYQPITGYVSNPAFTSQVSRKFGRGI